MIQVSNVIKRYGSHTAVNGVSFNVRCGEVVGFLGPNGAGKTTTLRILSGFIAMTSGDVRIGGHDIVGDSLRARRQIGYMPESCPLYHEMRVIEYLRFRAALKQVARKERQSYVREAMRQAAILDVAEVPIGELSKGYQQRVGLADALVAKPPILILDEPTSGLDPNQIRDVRSLLRELAADRAILFSTHILSEAEAVCDRVVMIAHGRIVAEGLTRDLIAQGGGSLEQLFYAVTGGDGNAQEALK